jgi:hypothetical protein
MLFALFVPAGLFQFQTIPGVETPGYCQMFLRNNQMAIAQHSSLSNRF